MDGKLSGSQKSVKALKKLDAGEEERGRMG